MSGRVADQAETLLRLVNDPRFAGQTWTWDKIGSVLGLNIRQARAVIEYIRREATEMYWTVGTYGSGYETVPTQSMRVAWPGLYNQLKHYMTRFKSLAHAFDVLSRIDPDPQLSAMAGREARYWQAQVVATQDRIDNMLALMDGGSPTV